MSYVLIFETDPALTTNLRENIAALGAVTVSVVKNGREAQMALMQHPQALAFVPLTDAENIIRSLHAIQPELPVVVLMPSGESMPKGLANQVVGKISADDQDDKLPGLLQKHLRDAMWDTAVLLNVLQQAPIGKLIKTVLFSRAHNHLAHWGELNTSQAIAVARQAGSNWDDTDYPVRIQFMYVPSRPSDFLLYTQRVQSRQKDIYLLTLIAAPETPLSRLRQQAQRLGDALLAMLQGETPVVVPETAVLDAKKSYALVWSPVRPLPAAIRKPLHQAIARLAQLNSCTITHLAIQAELVHLVVACPDDRDTAWAAYLFKNGSEEMIQKQFAVSANLWRTGYYATESTEPLTEAELSIFFEPDN